MSRLTRHEILKEDKFLTTLEAVRNLFLERRKQLFYGSAAFCLLLLAFLGSRYYLASRNEAAKDALSQALKTFHASVVNASSQANPGPSGDPVFTTEREKFEKALGEFKKVSADYSSSSAGKIARYYTALSLRELGRTDEAIVILEPLSQDKSDLSALAQRALASIYEQSGKLDKASAIYQRMVQSDDALVLKDESLMHLAQLYEQQGKSADATKIYQQVIKEFPGSSQQGEAERKLKQLAH